MILKNIIAGAALGAFAFFFLPQDDKELVTFSLHELPKTGVATYTVDVPYVDTVPMLNFVFPEGDVDGRPFATPTVSILEGVAGSRFVRVSIVAGYQGFEALDHSKHRNISI